MTRTLAAFALALAFLAFVGAPLAADTGFCPPAYCNAGKPDPWPNDGPLPNDQLLAAYLARYNCPVGVQPCRRGLSAEFFGRNWTALENWCRAGNTSGAGAVSNRAGGSAAALPWWQASGPAANSAKAAGPAPSAILLDYRGAVEALDALGLTDEAEYARRRLELQRATLRGVPAAQAMAAGRDCMATTTEATDGSFANVAGGPFNKRFWWEMGVGGLPTNRAVFNPGNPTLACGDTTMPGPFGFVLYASNFPPCRSPAVCGDGVLTPPETCASCARDCPPPPPRCGDGRVDPGETCLSCPADAGACPPPPPATTLVLGPTTHPFDLTATWRTPAGQTGTAKARPLETDTGSFWFFNPANLELMVKVLNGCALNGHYWVFAGGLTDVAVELRVSERSTGQLRLYLSPAGAPFAPIQDTQAFPCQ